MHQVILDPSGLASPPAGVLEISTEIDFLKHADDEAILLIREKELCRWAELYYTGRGIPYEIAVSPVDILRRICSSLSDAQAEAIIKKFADKLPDDIGLQTPSGLLRTFFPNSIWGESPSVEHFASYLHWLWHNDPDDFLAPFFHQLAEQWDQLYSGPIPLPYQRACDKVTALEVLDEWLGIKPSEDWKIIGAFPKPVPDELKSRARETWKKEIILSQGEFYYHLIKLSLPFSLLNVAADEAARYYISHPEQLKNEQVGALIPYLSEEVLSKLREKVPPPVPSGLPEDQEVMPWFLGQYLPFREWQHASGDQKSRELVDALSREFIDWYLRVYPNMLLGHPLQQDMSFHKMSDLVQEGRSAITLMVLLDGLNLGDSRQLLSKIQVQIPTLKIKKASTAFSSLPTVTQFSKDALLKGVAPCFAPDTGLVGKVIPQGKTPSNVLQGAQKGEIYIWSILEPDETYHKYTDQPVLKRNVEAQLDGIVKKIRDIVNEVSEELPLEIIITSDHGRLMAISDRKIGIPEGMTSHGRAAWGKSGKEFQASGFLVEGDLVFIHASRFGLLEDVVMPLNEDTFFTADGKTGVEAYTHGGLYPEEVIVPWIEFTRNIIQPQLEIYITGSGYSSNRGTLIFNVINLSGDEIELELLELLVPNEKNRIIDLGWKMLARDQVTRESHLEWWPDSKQAKLISGRLYIRAQKGSPFSYPCNVTLQVKELYTTEGPELEGLE